MYINTQLLQYPVSGAQIRAQYPNTSFPKAFIAPEPYAWVFPAPQPYYDTNTQGVREAAPMQVNGKWQQVWEVYGLDPDIIVSNQAAAQQRLIEEIVFNTQKRLDEFAKTRNYDGILSLCTYATSTVPKFRMEGQYGVDARDSTWAKLYEILEEVNTGQRPKPSGFIDIEPLLPTLAWPV